MKRSLSDELLLRILGTLNEAQARWCAGREALLRGRGGLQSVHEVTGISRPTILKGMKELKQKEPLGVGDRIRKAGAGRKRIETADTAFTSALEAIMDENTAGDPMSLLLWTNKSTTAIAKELTRKGPSVSDETVRRRLNELDYWLQSNRKTLEGDSPQGRDEQFRYINSQVKKFVTLEELVLSVETKKKEQVGNFKNSGRIWRRQGEPTEVNMHDFPSLGEGAAIPYGAYDVNRNEGFVNVGITDDTAEFAVESIPRWWRSVGRHCYPGAKRLLICADSGGSNGNRNRAWKYHLQSFVDESGLGVTVCQYPPGTSKWNKVEHRMLSYISMNWRGQRLISYEAVVKLIGATRTKTGLKVKARLDEKAYEAGVKITDEQMETLRWKPPKKNPQWNYTIFPRAARK